MSNRLSLVPRNARPARSRHAGGILLIGIITLLALATAALVLQQARLSVQASDRIAQTRQRLEQAALALGRFALLHKRLPCPADGAQESGLAQPPTAPSTAPYRCTTPDGTLPWKTLGLGAEDALDAWGRKLSYRVTDGQTGVIREGSMLHARTAGLVVNDRGRTLLDQAWVLISHGASGRGAWLPGGARMGLPAPGGDEASNAAAAPAAFVQRDEQVLDLSLDTSIAHFDDLLLSRSMGEVDAGFGLLRFDDRRLASPPPDFNGRNAGVSAVTFDGDGRHGRVTVAATGGNLARNSETSGWAIGVCSGACSSDATSMLGAGQSLSIKLSFPSSTPPPEQLALSVWSAGPAVQGTVVLRKAGVDLPGGMLALPSQPAGPGALVGWTNLAASPAAPFDEIELSATGGTRLFLSHLRLCAATEPCT